MQLNMTCKTCEFGSNESCCAENSKKSHQDDTECGDACRHQDRFLNSCDKNR